LFSDFAADMREAAVVLERAAKTARAMHLPSLDFARAIRLLKSMAGYADRELMWLAYIRHNELTEAPVHKKNLKRVRAGQKKSFLKKLAARRNGRLGGQSTSEWKQEAARQNGRKGGRPRKPPAIAQGFPAVQSEGSTHLIKEPDNRSCGAPGASTSLGYERLPHQ
jgi:hypothetical protein